MTARSLFLVVACCLPLMVAAGCRDASSSAAPASTAPKVDPKPVDAAEAEIAAELAKLSAEDRKLAEAQKTCPITGERLGSMGAPPKLTIKGETVFLCCSSCTKDAEADPDKTLKAVAEAKAKAKGK